jgi:hypothetical protein
MGASRSQNPTPATPSYPPGGVAGSTSGTNGYAQLPANSRGVYGLNDLKLMAAATGQTTVITSSGKNVHLDGGTRLLLISQAEAPAAASK